MSKDHNTALQNQLDEEKAELQENLNLKDKNMKKHEADYTALQVAYDSSLEQCQRQLREKDRDIVRWEDSYNELKLSHNDLGNQLVESKQREDDLARQSKQLGEDRTELENEKENWENEKKILENDVSSHKDKIRQMNGCLHLLLAERQSLLAENDQAYSEHTELQHLLHSTLDQLLQLDREFTLLLYGSSPLDHTTIGSSTLEQQIRALEQQKVHFETMALQLQNDQEAILQAFALLAKNAYHMACTKQHGTVNLKSLYQGKQESANIIREVFSQLDLELENKPAGKRRLRGRPGKKHAENQAGEPSTVQEKEAEEAPREEEERAILADGNDEEATYPPNHSGDILLRAPMVNTETQTDPLATAEPSENTQPSRSVASIASQTLSTTTSLATQTDPPVTAGPSTSTQTLRLINSQSTQTNPLILSTSSTTTQTTPLLAPPTFHAHPTTSSVTQTDFPSSPLDPDPSKSFLNFLLGLLLTTLFAFFLSYLVSLAAAGPPAYQPGVFFVEEMSSFAKALRWLGMEVRLEMGGVEEFGGLEW